MPIAAKLMMDKCNFDCKYCFQSSCEVDEDYGHDIQIDKVIETAKLLKKRYNHDFILHAGEITGYDEEVLVKLFKKTKEIEGKVSIQTNGYKFHEYIDLFKEYNVEPGFSFDGPEECNILRGYGDKQQRLQQAKQIEENIYLALEEGFNVGLIILLHKQNYKHIDKLKEFVIGLKDKGLDGGRFNIANVTSDIQADGIQLTNDELVDFYDELYDVCIQHGLKYSPFTDLSNSLQGKSGYVCKFKPCDYYATPSLIAIHKDGKVGNCVKTYRGGEPYVRAENERTDIRQNLLKETDCENCEWFKYCTGGCPNNGINGDWRRKTKYCEVWKHLFEKIQNNLKTLKVETMKPKPEKSRKNIANQNNHNDGVEHIDGNMQHLDSANPAEETCNKHTDGIKHTDGDMIHLDG